MNIRTTQIAGKAAKPGAAYHKAVDRQGLVDAQPRAQAKRDRSFTVSDKLPTSRLPVEARHLHCVVIGQLSATLVLSVR